jgi:hypothetical protein
MQYKPKIHKLQVTRKAITNPVMFAFSTAKGDRFRSGDYLRRIQQGIKNKVWGPNRLDDTRCISAKFYTYTLEQIKEKEVGRGRPSKIGPRGRIDLKTLSTAEWSLREVRILKISIPLSVQFGLRNSM